MWRWQLKALSRTASTACLQIADWRQRGQCQRAHSVAEAGGRSCEPCAVRRPYPMSSRSVVLLKVGLVYVLVPIDASVTKLCAENVPSQKVAKQDALFTSNMFCVPDPPMFQVGLGMPIFSNAATSPPPTGEVPMTNRRYC